MTVKSSKIISHNYKPITPVYPKANGLVENFNKNIEKIIHTSGTEGKNWKQELFKFLRNYRATPHTTTGRAPAELLFQKRESRIRLPQIATVTERDDELLEKEAKQKAKMKLYADRKSTVQNCIINIGDSVLVRQSRVRKRMPYYELKPYKVIEHKGNMIIAERADGRRMVRNSSFFKRWLGVTEDAGREMIPMNEQNNNGTERSGEQNVVNEPLRRSTRLTTEPVRYPIGVPQ